MGLCSTLRSFTREISIALLAFLASVKDTFDSCGVCDGGAARVLDFVQSDDATKVYEE